MSTSPSTDRRRYPTYLSVNGVEKLKQEYAMRRLELRVLRAEGDSSKVERLQIAKRMLHINQMLSYNCNKAYADAALKKRDEQETVSLQAEISQSRCLRRERKGFDLMRQFDRLIVKDMPVKIQLRHIIEKAHGEIDRLNAVIATKDDAIYAYSKELADSRKRVDEFASKSGRCSGENMILRAKGDDRDKEIERLRAEMQSSADDLRELMEVAYRDCPYEAQKIADRLVAALKGAE